MIGQKVGQYEIQEQLGKGGMGIVYKALDTNLHRTVALKFLPPHLSADENSKQRFMQEARAASALDHANICTIHDITEAEDGQLFIVMSFYDGQTLKYILEKGKMSVPDSVATAHQISQGLARAHEAGIVHRDIKPANIMVTNRGEVKILDFGVAKLSESAELTKTGSTIGTAAYMSPEQARGETVDLSADIWSVGILLYEMLTGTRPFEGGYEAAMVYAIVNQDPTPPHELVPEVPVAVSNVVAKCLAKSQAERFASAADLVASLDPFLNTSAGFVAPVTSAPVSEQAPNLIRVGGLFALVSLVVLAIVYAGMIGFGLPDWVFPTGVILMLIGLPSLLIGAANERARLEGRPKKGLLSNLSFRKAVWAGVFSMSGLVLFSTAFMFMRSAGIGPAATLQSRGALEANAKLIVAQFANSTSDQALSESVTELVRIDLSQSDALNVMDGSDVVAVLGRMNRAPDSEIDLDTAMEIAAREGAEAVVAGEISPIGQGFVISARLLAASDGSELVALRETAENDGAIIGAVDRLSGNLRERIGESIKSIRANEDLDRVTTASLDALRLFSQGVAAEDAGDSFRAIELLNQALEHDSTFAMAYRKLAVVYGNAGSSNEKVVEAATKAFELRQRLPERERGLAAAYYYSNVAVNNDRVLTEYENVLEKYPDENAALNNSAIIYNERGEYEKAERNLRHAMTLGPRYVFYVNLITTLSSQKRWEEADELFDRFDELIPNHPAGYWMRSYTKMAQGEYDEARTLLRASTLNNNFFWQIADITGKAWLDWTLGKFSAAEINLRQVLEINIERDVPSQALLSYIRLAHLYMDYHEDMDQSREVLKEGLAAIDLESIPPTARPYNELISIFSRLGDVTTAGELAREYEETVPDGIRNGWYSKRLAQSDLLLAEGRTEEALTELSATATIDRCAQCFLFERAQLLEQTERIPEAIEMYIAAIDKTVPIDTNELLAHVIRRAPSYFRLGELHAQLGNNAEAVDAFTKFVDIWKDADAVLQPQVEYARRRIDELTSQIAREPQ